jgi:hypothetical protein
MPLVMFDRNGPPEAMACPGVICDYCGEFVTGDGNVEWFKRCDDEMGPIISPFYFTHSDSCSLSFSREKGETTYSDGWLPHRIRLSQFLRYLQHNLAHRFEEDRAVGMGEAEYVAPRVSGYEEPREPLRIGHYKRHSSAAS